MVVWFRIHRHAPDRFEEVLARCLAAIEAGASVESCLADNPTYAERLAPALRMAGAVRGHLAVRPDPAFVQRTRARIIGAAAGVQPVEAVQPAPVRRPVGRSRYVAVAGMALAVLVLAVLTPVVAVSSADALPGDWNYGLKRKTEGVLLTLGIKDHLDLADERAAELRQLAAVGAYRYIPVATRAYEAELAEVRKPLQGSALPPPAEVRKIEGRVATQQAVIQAAAEKVEKATEAQSPDGGDVPPPPVVLADARQATQSALSTASETQQQAAAAAVTADAQVQARASATATVAPRSPAAVAGGSTSTATPTPTPTPAASRTAAPRPVESSTAPASATATAGTAEPSPSTTAGPLGTTAVASPTASSILSGTPAGSPPATAAPPTASPPVTVAATAPPTIAPTRPPAVPVAPSLPRQLTPEATPTEPPRVAATPTPTATPSPTPGPATPAPTSVVARPVAPPLQIPMIQAGPGQVKLLYSGAAMPVNQALADLAGKYTLAVWTPYGSPFSVAYDPAKSTNLPTLTPGSILTISLTETVRIPAGAFWPAQ